MYEDRQLANIQHEQWQRAHAWSAGHSIVVRWYSAKGHLKYLWGWGRLVRSSDERSSSVLKTFRSRKCQTLSQPQTISHSQTFLHQTTTNCNTVPTLGTNSSSTVGLSRLSYAIVKLKPTASGETQAADEAENGTSSRRVTTIRNIKLFWTQKRN